MRRLRLWAAGLCLLGASTLAAAQTGGPNGGPAPAADTAKPVAFDVISVKPADPSSMRGGIRLTADGFSMSSIRVDLLLNEGFQLGPNELTGEPDWAKSEGWDINAKVASEDVDALKKMSFDDRRRMFIQVLQERFGLKYHTEKRELPVYALVVAKGGPKMTEAKEEPDAVKNVGKGGPGKLMGNPGRITAEGTTTEFLCNVLSRMIGRNIVDKTGLTAHYDFTLAWAPEQGGGDTGEKALMRGPAGPGGGPGGPGGMGGASDPGSSASVFTAVQEQLGLKLEPQKAMVDIVVVDHLEKPSEN